MSGSGPHSGAKGSGALPGAPLASGPTASAWWEATRRSAPGRERPPRSPAIVAGWRIIWRGPRLILCCRCPKRADTHQPGRRGEQRFGKMSDASAKGTTNKYIDRKLARSGDGISANGRGAHFVRNATVADILGGLFPLSHQPAHRNIRGLSCVARTPTARAEISSCAAGAGLPPGGPRIRKLRNNCPSVCYKYERIPRDVFTAPTSLDIGGGRWPRQHKSGWKVLPQPHRSRWNACASGSKMFRMRWRSASFAVMRTNATKSIGSRARSVFMAAESEMDQQILELHAPARGETESPYTHSCL
jgi:hypothetical protein